MGAASPLRDWSRFPPFDRIAAAEIEPVMDELLGWAETELQRLEAEAEADASWDALMVPLQRIEDEVSRVWGVVGHLLAVRNSPELRRAHEAVQPKLVRFGNRLQQSRAFFDGMRTLRDAADAEGLDEPQRRILEHDIRAAEHGGVGLDGAQRERFNALSEELAELQTRFSNNVLDAVKAWSLEISDRERLAGLPQAALAQYAQAARAAGHDSASAENGPWRIGLDLPSFQPLMQHARDRALREQCYRAFIARASSGEHDNAPLIRRILQIRAEMASLLGYGSYAERSLSSKMAGSVAAVDALLEELYAACHPAAERDLGELIALAAEHDAPEAEDFQVWDQPFWAERLREQRFGLKDEDLRPYFTLERVLESLFAVSQDLFGIRVEPDREGLPVWHEDVRVYRVYDESGAELAAWYLDPYSRPADKRGGAWMNGCVGRSRECAPAGADVRLPVAYICCNQTPPVDDVPSLMSFREVETLFHEFGHALQHMLTRVDHGAAAGISGVEWDAVEIASQFMEHWCYHRPNLVGMSRHYQSGEPLPSDLVDRIIAARSFRGGSNMLRQLNFGMLDLELYHRFDPDGEHSPFDVQQRIEERCSVLPSLPENRFLCSFLHIFAGGYAAGYYSYKWAEVLSSDCFGAFEEAGVHDDEARKQLGRRLRETLFALGGGRHPMAVFRDFRGREPSTEPLLRHCGLEPSKQS